MEPNTSENDVLIHAENLAAQGQLDEAIDALRAITAKSPHFIRSQLLLSKLLMSVEKHEEAIQTVQLAERFDPLAGAFQQISQAMQRGERGRAAQIAAEMLHQVPGHPRAIFTLASLAQMVGDHEERIRQLRDGLSVAPANVAFRQMLVGALEEAGELRAALQEADDLVRLQKSFPNLLTQATLLFRIGRATDALSACEEALALRNNPPAMIFEATLLSAQILRVLGDTERCIERFQHCLRIAPSSGAAWWGLADLKTYRFSDEEQQRLRALTSDRRISPQDRCMLGFALAKSLESDRKRSMAAYQAANDVYPDKSFNREGFVAAVRSIKQAFQRDALSRQASAISDSATPIFVLGMPRSGSTLIEQILASHSQVQGTVESGLLPSIKRLAHKYCAGHLGGDYLSKIGDIPAEELQRLGQRYLEESEVLHDGSTPFFTDKMPFNFEHVGLIRKILPKARIIDARRNPLDCGLSNFRQFFVQGAGFSYDLGNIGAYYNGYLELMDHWNEVAPSAVHCVQYEDLVRKPQETIATMLAYIGLPFEEACLKHQENKRAVRSASSEQVRQAIYTSSIGMWREFEDELAPLTDALGAETLKRFQDYLT